MLPTQNYFDVIKYTPLVSIDLILYNPLGQVLVGLRRNRPAQNYWFVPGGRIKKNETIEEAFDRICIGELSMSFPYEETRFKGVYQHLYEDNAFGDPEFGTHYVVLAHEIILHNEMTILPGDQQHQKYQWYFIEDLLLAEDVHPNTKFYFQSKVNTSINGGVYPRLYF